MNLTELLKKLSLSGGEWVLYLLLMCSVLSLTVIIQKFVYFHRSRIDWGAFHEMFTTFLSNGDYVAATEYVRRITHPAARVLLAGMEQMHKGSRAVEEILVGKRISEKFLMEDKLIFLGTLGNNAPFIGLFGTVLGIIKAFHDLASAPNPNPSVVMAGVSEALVATAVGLVVAIPAVIAYNYFQRRIKAFVTQMDEGSKALLAYLKSEIKDEELVRHA